MRSSLSRYLVGSQPFVVGLLDQAPPSPSIFAPTTSSSP